MRQGKRPHQANVTRYGPLTRYVNLQVAHASGMPETFSPPPRVSDLDMHHGTCVTHVPWCMPGSLAGDFLWSRWRGKRSRHSRRMRTCNFTYLVRGPCLDIWLTHGNNNPCINTTQTTNVIKFIFNIWAPPGVNTDVFAWKQIAWYSHSVKGSVFRLWMVLLSDIL